MAFTTAGYAAELAPIESTDSVVQAVAKSVRSIIKETGIAEIIPDLQIFFPDFSNAGFGAKKPPYYTEGCVSVLPSTLVINSGFLRNTEAAILSFGLFDDFMNTVYMRNDACMFGLVKRIRDDREQWLVSLRGFEEQRKSAERYALDELTLVALFFCAHEIGHLKDGVNMGRYAAFLDPAKPLEDRLTNAAVKLRRHASEFEDYGFDLPGWKGVVTSEHEASVAVDKVRKTMSKEEADDDARSVEWFKKEISADEYAVNFMIEYLKGQPVRRRWLLVRGLFAAALHSWYEDFLTFCELMVVPRLGAKPMLSFELMKNPKAFISAASLFGDVHRCTILRSTLAIQQILEAFINSDGADGKEEGENTFLARASALFSSLFGEAKPAMDEGDRQLDMQSTQRQLLLAIHMDTVVKLAYVGASMPLIKEKENQRGTEQLMFIEFEAIDQSLKRLKRMLNQS